MTAPSDTPLTEDEVTALIGAWLSMSDDIDGDLSLRALFELQRLRRPRLEAVEAGAMIIFGNDLAWPQMLEKNRERYREKARAVLALASPQGEKP